MEIREIKFTSNIKCQGCIAKIAPFFSAEPAIRTWHVEVGHPQKVLTVETHLGTDAICVLVAKAGFRADPVQ